MSTYSDGVLALSPALYWRLGESAGPTATDASGNGRNGTYNGSITFSQAGALSGDADTSVLFPNSTGAFISSSYAPFVNGSSRTFLGWEYRTSAFVNADGIFSGSGTNPPWLSFQGSSGDLTFEAADGGTQAVWTGAAPNYDQWYMWALTFNEATDTAELFINGVSQGTQSMTTAYNASPGNFEVGRVVSGFNPFQGRLDEIAVFTSILSGASILDLYQRGTLTGPYAPPPPPTPPPSAAKPPLGLIAEVTLADGSRYRWDSGARSAVDRPQGITFRTKKGDGFADGQLNLSRRIDQDYIDLNLYDDFTLVGYDGAIAYEGRVAATPRSLGSVHQVGVVLQGWMSHARDRKFVDAIVDREAGAWQNAGLAGQTSQTASFADMSWSTERGGGLICTLPGTLGAQASMAEAWYVAPPGGRIGKLMFVGQDSNMPGTWEVPKITLGDSEGAHTDVTNVTFNNTLQTHTPATARAAAMWRVYNLSVAATPTLPAYRKVSVVAVYSNSGIPTRPITTDAVTPDGVFASDVITNIAQRFCPKLSTAGVQATSYAIPHLVFKDPTDPYDAFLDVNKYHLWNLAVYEGKTLFFKPFDYTDYDWEVRLSDQGTSLDAQGDAVGQFANGIAVNYTDVGTGVPARITPDDDATLKDTSVTNPANTHGLTVWHEESMSVPTTATGATQFGRAALAEFNQPKAPGTIHIEGHIRDRAGHWQQGWKVRAGDRIVITDHPNDRVRLVVETEWNHDSKTLTMAVDQSFMRLDAVVDRIQTALVANNLT